MNSDNKYHSMRQRYIGQHTPLIILMASVVAVIFFAFGYTVGSSRCQKQPSANTSESAGASITKTATPTEEQNQQPAQNNADTAKPQLKTYCEQVHNGDTITALLGSYFSPAQILAIARQSEKVFPLSRLCAGHQYRIEVEGDNFVSFYYDIDKNEQLIIRQVDDKFDIRREPIPYEIKVESIGGVINSNLFATVGSLGESSELAQRLMDIFAWDIDFIRDIRQGDYFVVLVEKRYRDGNLAGYGKLLAAEFNNAGRSYFAYYFDDGSGHGGYYDENGKSLRKAFLKAPLKYTRISSGFTRRRFHPVLNKWKPHLAIDYAAPTGTPVHAVADGVIIQKSRDRYNGNKLRLRHSNGYETTYIHLSRFARGMRKGKRVRQGETIAYVGMTGLATGPHLDFRVFKNGRAINPLKMHATAAKPLARKDRKVFAQLVQKLKEQLAAKKAQLLTTTSSAKSTAPGGNTND